ncbi:MAG TPA: hypothetical protein VE441_08435 [Mycobacterium sp.]|nr:hypothetical protein [Mycobacterium sp.]
MRAVRLGLGVRASVPCSSVPALWNRRVGVGVEFGSKMTLWAVWYAGHWIVYLGLT